MCSTNAQNLLVSYLIIVAFIVLSAHAVVAQSSTASLSGTIEDERGAVIPGASVVAVNVGTRLERKATTDEKGYFVLSLLPPSTYVLRVESQGFSPVEVRDVVLNVGDQKALQIQLKAGDVNAQVTVDSNAETVRTDGSVGTVVNQQFVHNIPLNGRSFNTLLELTPGVVLTQSTNNNSGQFSVNGQRSDANYFMVDGVGANVGVTSGTLPALGQTGGGALPPVSALGGTTSLVTIDAMQEFKVLTSSFAPEYGRSPGAQVLIATRSGGNQFHGAAFEYFRDKSLDANDWFANNRGLPRTGRQHDFGGTFSGPILLPRFGEGGQQPGYNGHDKTFFFFSYEGLRLRQPNTRITLVPSLAARQTSTLSPELRALLNAYPIPNGRVFADNTAEFASGVAQPATLDATSIRVDHTVRKGVELFGRYNDAPSQIYQQGAFGSFAMSTNSTTQLDTKTLTAGSTISLNPKMVYDVRFNWSRVRGATQIGNDNFGGATVPPDSLFFPFGSRANARAQPLIVGISFYGIGNTVNNLQRQLNLIGNVAISATASHQLKFGADYRRLRPTNGQPNYLLTSVFSNVSAILSNGGIASTVIFNAMDAADLKVQFYNLSLYAEDAWRISSRFTLTYGTRWEYDPPPTESTKGLYGLTSLDNLSTLTLTPPGTPLWKAQKDNFAPRLGVAYQISQQPGRELVVRGGVGMFYDLGNPAAAGVLAQFPYSRSRTSFSIPWPLTTTSPAIQPFPTTVNPPFGGVSALSDPNLKLPVTYQWNVAVEQSLGAGQSISASYVGAAARSLYLTKNLSKPNPNFTALNVYSNGGTSDYNALQLQFERRLSRGLQALASYAWSRCLDSGSFDGSTLNGLTVQSVSGERGNCEFDIRHAFSSGVTYRIPSPRFDSWSKALFKDWWIDSMFRARSAAPVDITYSRTVVPFGGITLRPDIVPGQPLYLFGNACTASNLGAPCPGGRRINKAAFSIPTSDRQGSLARNTLRGFSVWQFDMALRRQFNFRKNFIFNCGPRDSIFSITLTLAA